MLFQNKKMWNKAFPQLDRGRVHLTSSIEYHVYSEITKYVYKLILL